MKPWANPSSACAVIARDCQRQSGAANVPAARVPSAGFRILQGTPKRYVTKAVSGNDIARVFCGDCGTPLYV
jgi:hypothetical protein